MRADRSACGATLLLTVCILGAGGLLAGCGSSSSSSPASRAPAPASSVPAAAAAASGRGTIKGEPFTAAGAFVQYDPMGKGWWVVLTGPGHACTDVTRVAGQLVSAVTPNVNVFFHVSGPQVLPPTGHTVATGVTFSDRSGYPTTLNGPAVTAELRRVEAAPGGHWQGRLSAPGQALDGKTFAFLGSFDAVVCPPVRG